MSRTTIRSVAVTAAQYGIALAAFAWLLSQVELANVATLLADVAVSTVLALLVVSAAGLLARFYTWHVVIRPVRRASFSTAAGVDLIVNFVNQLLPSRLSGRVAAPFVLRSRTGMAYADAAAVSGVHTGMYAILYGGVSLLGVAIGYGRLPIELVALLALATGLYVFAGAFVLLAGMNLTLLDRLVGALAGVVRRVPRVGDSLSERVTGLLEFTSASTVSFRELSGHPGVWLRYAAGWTGAMVLAPGVRVWLLLTAFGATFEPTLLLPVYLLTAYSVTLLPLTPGGIGVTEATATAVFVALGVPGDVVVPVVLVDRTLGVYLPALAGWYPSLKLDRSSLATEE